MQNTEMKNVEVCSFKEIKKKYGIKSWIMFKFKKKISFLARIYLRSGHIHEMITSASGRFFSHSEQKYFIDKDKMTWNPKMKIAELSYYQGCPEPIEIKYNKEFRPNIDSSSLEKAIKFEYAKSLLSAGNFDKKVDLALLFSGLAMVSSVVTAFIVMRATGVFG